MVLQKLISATLRKKTLLSLNNKTPISIAMRAADNRYRTREHEKPCLSFLLSASFA